MVSVAILIRTAAAVMISSSAFAADMPLPQPQIQYQPLPLVIEQPASAWYLRGYIGIGMNSEADFIFQGNPLNGPVDILTQHGSLGDTVFFGGGVGYEFNNWLRFDVTAEYRSRTPFYGFITYQNGPAAAGDQYNAFLKSDIFLANAYIDLGTWNCLTPFIGFGIGGAYNTFQDLSDLGTTAGNGVGTNASQLNFAWALHAGIAYNVTQNFTMELSYRYLNYGSVSDQINCFGGCNPDTYKLQNLTSQDFMFGMRWRFPIESAPIMVAPRPVMMQPAPVPQQPYMTPQQPYMVPQQPMMVPQPGPPPLSTRG